LESVHAFAWDAANQELMDIEGTGAPNGAPGNVAPADLAGVVGLRQLDLRHGGQRSDVELQAWADAQLLKSRLAKVRGRALVQGYGEIQPGDVVELAGVGDRFNGTAFVAGVRHEINVRNWETDIEFGLPPEWLMDVFDDVPAHPAGGLLPPVEGLQIGLVTALEGDPDGEYRVQVRVPMIDAAEEGVWARMALLDAGADRGTYIRPEIGDEVILGFLGGDPRNPVILGGVHSSAAAAPIEPTDDNHEKGVVTRSGIRFVFDDETSEATLETPNGNTVVVSDDAGSVTLADEHGNTVVLDADGVAIDSAGDITLSASGDVTVEGTNVSLAATADVTAEASANATLSGSAQTEITGSIVKIN
jgi:Rhs element Vgr protein